MKVTHVSIQPTEAAINSGRPALTPELLAACGARYSRNNEGLESILDKIDPNNIDRSVDTIFRLIDYGHQSIADMVPIAMFIDGISIWLAYYIWTLCPTAGGQESSTRYIRLNKEGLIDPSLLGIPSAEHGKWLEQMEQSFEAYKNALKIWELHSEQDPSSTRIPETLLNDPSEDARKKVKRMKRNYAFDRARYFIPNAAATNVMLVMSARAWVQLCQNLLSNYAPEAKELGNKISQELELSAPRLKKHAVYQESNRNGQLFEFDFLKEKAHDLFPHSFQENSVSFEHAPKPQLEIMLPPDTTTKDVANALQHHDHRYAWLGSSLCRTSVRFRWEAISLAEIRDLNRHRTGTKYCPLIPVGFYSALEQIQDNETLRKDKLLKLSQFGHDLSYKSRKRLQSGGSNYIYWTLLGTQFPFEHTTTGDKFIYEAELRTGLGAHYRYAKHLHDMLELWYSFFPETRTMIDEGSAEPE